MQQYRTRRRINRGEVMTEGMESIQHEIEEIHGELSRKQDRIPATAWLTLVAWAISITVGAVWWSATANEKLNNLIEVVKAGTADRYTRTEASAAITVINHKIKALQEHVMECRSDHRELKHEVNKK